MSCFSFPFKGVNFNLKEDSLEGIVARYVFFNKI